MIAKPVLLSEHARWQAERRGIEEATDLMKVTFDAETDTLTIILRDARVVESDEDKPGVVLDYDALQATWSPSRC